MNNRLLLATTLLLSGFSLVGCTVYDPDLLPDVPPDDLCGTPGNVPCVPEGTSSEDDMETAAFMLTNITLNQSVGGIWRDIGLNLDGHDTQAPDFGGDCTPVSPSPDGNNGVDNQFGGTLWNVIQARLPTLECEINGAHSQGHGSLIIELSEWNGTVDDDDVTISIIPSLDATSENIDAADCADITQIGDASMGEIEFHELFNGDPGTLRAAPIMNGNDSVCTNPAGRTNGNPGDDITVTDTNAYVSGGVMVFSLTAGSDFSLFSDRSSVQIRLNQGSLIMPMSTDFQNIEGGYAAGRFPFTALSQVGPEIGICDPSVLADSYRTFIDILDGYDATADGMDDCDALSVGVGFDGVRANVVGSASSEVPPFILCNGSGPAAQPKIEWPIEACCNAFVDLGDSQDCSLHYNP